VALLPTDLLPSEAPPSQLLEKLNFPSKRVHSIPLRIYGKAIAQCAEQDEEFTGNLPLLLLGVLYIVFPLQLFRMDRQEISRDCVSHSRAMSLYGSASNNVQQNAHASINEW
jgi:hypothetical protein